MEIKISWIFLRKLRFIRRYYPQSKYQTAGQPNWKAFRPRPKDEGKLSVDLFTSYSINSNRTLEHDEKGERKYYLAKIDFQLVGKTLELTEQFGIESYTQIPV